MSPPQRIELTATGSVPQHPPFVRPPKGAPNVVAIVLDDTGFAQLGCFGSDISTPHMDRLADGGLRYRSFHVTSLCSPTRASFFTGRNHHAVGMGFLTDIPMGYPGYTSRIPKTATPLPRVLRDNGYSTMAVGKWHLTPRFERSAGGPFDRWPLGFGFDRYYGFLNGDANHWAPSVISDNHYLEPPPGPGKGTGEDGDYHLSEDLAEQAKRMVLDQQQAAPGKPFFLYFALGAMHAPHHVAPSWVEPYKGKFDHGWDRWREEIFARQIESGVVPEGTLLSERPEWMESWDSLPEAERKMHARQQEVFAGFLTHTDAQIGRLVSFLESYGLLDDTLLLLFSDNGASAEGGKIGSPNEHRFTARIVETKEENIARMDDWGLPKTYNHYSWGWAWAGNTPLKMWKRYAWLGGTRTPLIVHWPKGIEHKGEVRQQFSHVIDLMPTILDAVGIEAPESVDGISQQRVDGESLRPTFNDPEAPDPRSVQYFEMLGSRAIYADGWKATTDHISMGILDEEELATGSRDFDLDSWLLYDLRRDFSESVDVAGEHPETVRRMTERWLVEAGRNNVLPIDDSFVHRVRAMIPPVWPPSNHQTFLPEASPVCDESVPMLFGGFRITATVEVPVGGATGMLCSLGDWNGGYALYVADNKLVFSFSRAGELLEVVGSETIPEGPGKLAIWYTTDASKVPGHKGEAKAGAFVLLHGEQIVGQLPVKGMLPIAIQHGGAGLRLGRDHGIPVSERYAPPYHWTGDLRSVTFDTPGAVPEPGETLRAALHAD